MTSAASARWCADPGHPDHAEATPHGEYAHHGVRTEIKFVDGDASVALHQYVDKTTDSEPVLALLETRPSSFMNEADLRALAALLLKTADQVANPMPR